MQLQYDMQSTHFSAEHRLITTHGIIFFNKSLDPGIHVGCPGAIKIIQIMYVSHKNKHLQ